MAIITPRPIHSQMITYKKKHDNNNNNYNNDKKRKRNWMKGRGVENGKISYKVQA